MITVGILVRVADRSEKRVTAQLEALEGVSTIELEQAGSVGCVIQAPSAEAATDLMRRDIESLTDVLCAWPVQIELGEDELNRPIAPPINSSIR